MDVVSFCPLRVASLAWQPRAGLHVLTVVAKATFRLGPTLCPLAEHQDEINEDDNHWNDDPTRSLQAPSDLVPFKPRADVILVGSAFSPTKEPVAYLTARLAVAGVDKIIDVWADRLRLPDGTLQEGAPFVKMPLRYERAAVGATNPVGMRPEPRPDRGGGVPMPNLQPHGRWPEPMEPVGFGPISPTWPSRAKRLPRGVQGAPADWLRQAMPEGIDPGYFNAAPEDQQVPQLRSNEHLLLANLHPQYPKLVTSLPGIAPSVIVERNGATEELTMTADTLWIDTDRGICTLVWRGQLRMDRLNQPGRVSVNMAQVDMVYEVTPGASVEEVRAGTQGTLPEPRTVPAPAATTAAVGARTLTDDDLELVGTTVPPTHTREPALPFASVSSTESLHAVLARLPARNEDQDEDEAKGATMMIQGDAFSRLTLPFAGTREPARPPAQPPAQPVAQPAAQSSAQPPAQPVVHQPLYVQGARNLEDSPPPAASTPSTPPLTVGQLAAMGKMVASSASTPAAEARPPAIGSIAVVSAAESAIPNRPQVASLSDLERAGVLAGVGGLSVLGASNAAAGPVPRVTLPAAPEQSPGRSFTPVEPLWFDETYLDRIRAAPALSAILTAQKAAMAKARRAEKKAPARPNPNEPNPAREDVGILLALGEPISAEDVQTALSNAVDERGMFTPPILLVGGELEFPFDEVETLKATVSAVTPLAANDKKLKETIDTVTELMRTPWLQAAGSGTERLTSQVKEAFAAGNRLLPSGQLEMHIERILLEQRHYQQRTLLGQRWIRALLAPTGSSARIPTYLPQTLGRELPMFKRFQARIIAEARAQIDQYEVYPSALRVIALGRVLGPPARR